MRRPSHNRQPSGTSVTVSPLVSTSARQSMLLQQSKGYQSCARDGVDPNRPTSEHATAMGQCVIASSAGWSPANHRRGAAIGLVSGFYGAKQQGLTQP